MYENFNSLESIFKQLTDKAPDADTIKSLLRIKKVLNLDDNDSLWLIIIALEYYQFQYSKFPLLIKNTAKDIILDLKQSESIIQNRIKNETLEYSKSILSDLSKHSNKHIKSAVLLFSSLLIISSLLMFFFFKSFTSFDAGFRSGYQTAIIEMKHKQK